MPVSVDAVSLNRPETTPEHGDLLRSVTVQPQRLSGAALLVSILGAECGRTPRERSEVALFVRAADLLLAADFTGGVDPHRDDEPANGPMRLRVSIPLTDPGEGPAGLVGVRVRTSDLLFSVQTQGGKGVLGGEAPIELRIVAATTTDGDLYPGRVEVHPNRSTSPAPRVFPTLGSVSPFEFVKRRPSSPDVTVDRFDADGLLEIGDLTDPDVGVLARWSEPAVMVGRRGAFVIRAELGEVDIRRAPDSGDAEGRDTETAGENEHAGVLSRQLTLALPLLHWSCVEGADLASVDELRTETRSSEKTSGGAPKNATTSFGLYRSGLRVGGYARADHLGTVTVSDPTPRPDPEAFHVLRRSEGERGPGEGDTASWSGQVFSRDFERAAQRVGSLTLAQEERTSTVFVFRWSREVEESGEEIPDRAFDSSEFGAGVAPVPFDYELLRRLGGSEGRFESVDEVRVGQDEKERRFLLDRSALNRPVPPEEAGHLRILGFRTDGEHLAMRMPMASRPSSGSREGRPPEEVVFAVDARPMPHLAALLAEAGNTVSVEMSDEGRFTLSDRSGKRVVIARSLTVPEAPEPLRDLLEVCGVPREIVSPSPAGEEGPDVSGSRGRRTDADEPEEGDEFPSVRRTRPVGDSREGSRSDRTDTTAPDRSSSPGRPELAEASVWWGELHGGDLHGIRKKLANLRRNRERKKRELERRRDRARSDEELRAIEREIRDLQESAAETDRLMEDLDALFEGDRRPEVRPARNSDPAPTKLPDRS